jgi:hypothetical protein
MRAPRIARPLVILLVVDLVVSPPLAHAGEQFHNVKLMVNTGGKAEEQDAVLSLEDEAVVVRSVGGTVLKTLPYANLKSLEYSYSKSPRWKSGAVAAVFVGVFAIPIFFMKGKKHWLTAVAGEEFALLRLDKNNYKIIVPALEAKTGLKVEVVADEK